MQRYQRRPEYVEAIRWHGHNDKKFAKETKRFARDFEVSRLPQSMMSWFDWPCARCGGKAPVHGMISTDHRHYVVCPGDWFVHDGRRAHVLTPEDFDRLFVKAED